MKKVEKYYIVRYIRQSNLGYTNNVEPDADEILFEDEESARKFIDDLSVNSNLIWARLATYENYYPDLKFKNNT